MGKLIIEHLHHDVIVPRAANQCGVPFAPLLDKSAFAIPGPSALRYFKLGHTHGSDCLTTIKAAILAAMFASTAGVACANPLDAERGQTRPLIIVAPDAGSVAITALTAALALPHTQAGFADRQVVVFTVVAGTGKRDGATLSAAATGALLNALGLRADGPTTVVLVGKDGGLKLRSAQLDLAEILRTIDAMPMRRAETRQR